LRQGEVPTGRRRRPRARARDPRRAARRGGFRSREPGSHSEQAPRRQPGLRCKHLRPL